MHLARPSAAHRLYMKNECELLSAFWPPTAIWLQHVGYGTAATAACHSALVNKITHLGCRWLPLLLLLSKQFSQQFLLSLRLCRQFVKLKSRQEFRSAAALSDPQAIEFSIALAETQLDNVTRQRQLLNELRDEGNLKGPK